MWSFAVHQEKVFDTSANRYPLTSRQKDPGHTERSPRHVIRLALRVSFTAKPMALAD